MMIHLYHFVLHIWIFKSGGSDCLEIHLLYQSIRLKYHRYLFIDRKKSVQIIENQIRIELIWIASGRDISGLMIKNQSFEGMKVRLIA